MEVLLQKTLPLKGDTEGIVWVYSEKPDIWSKYAQYVEEVPKNIPIEVPKNIPIEVPKNIPPKPEKKGAKTQKILPMEIIIQLSQNNIMNTDHIKQQLHTFISQKEFSKAFGVKKCSEIMSGITNNKWNKSLVLFLSFLFDTKFIYLNKEVVFDNDKCNSVIHI